MKALEKFATKQYLTDELVKVAKLRLSDIEDHMGMLLDKKHHKEVHEHIKERHGKSFALRHPYLTGIPTLGIAPAVAKGRATERIARRMLRNHEELRGKHEENRERERRHSMEREKLEIERSKAEAPVRAVGAAFAGAAPLAHSYMRHKREMQENK